MAAEIKAKVQDAYVRALKDRFRHMQRGSNIDELFRNVRLYGRDAGIDFVETNLARIVQEAVDRAECKEASLEMSAYGFGKGARAGMEQALRDATGLKVELNGATLRLIWAEATPGLV
ncbi:hypothetical protein FV218_12020 [Methylobacterium sp. WL69]|uniref:hypothetical protein n=1 Tax=Methylobacterium sp. WL69 TaxID=2603893 RepID=UPI0011C74BFF|nr:hypothetical protein [Methylobacterium sp. WL69]TXM73145.1 hypothetical protein FV218_12020 [Methylobacterium sp. WL69]